MTTNGETLYARSGRLHYFVREIFKRLRVPATDASKVADMMVAADLAGVASEGVARLPFHAERLSSGLVNPAPKIRVVHQAPSAATMDGDNGLGPVVATAAMEHAIHKAKRQGAAVVAVRHSNDFGMAGHYARMALSEQMIGIALSNASPMVVPPGGSQAVLGTNPLAGAVAVAENRPPFVLDISTSVASKGRIEEAGDNRESIPHGWALDLAGEPTTDPAAALEALRLLPLGSRPETGSHKGYGLGLFIDILCGVLSGGSFGLELTGAEGYRPGVAKLGHFFMAIRIRAFGPYVKFRNRIDVMLRKLTSKKDSGAARIFYPGEPEFEVEQLRRAHGIPLPPDLAKKLHGLASGLELEEAWEHLLEGRK
jgi:LDH2 family malate/lactate/ureidoglycolate dehydrogenase